MTGPSAAMPGAALPGATGPTPSRAGGDAGKAGTDPAQDPTSVAFLAALSAALPVPVAPTPTPAPPAATSGAVQAAGPSAAATAGGPGPNGTSLTGARGSLPAPVTPAFVAPPPTQPGLPTPATSAGGAPASGALRDAAPLVQAPAVQWVAPPAPALEDPAGGPSTSGPSAAGAPDVAGTTVPAPPLDAGRDAGPVAAQPDSLAPVAVATPGTTQGSPGGESRDTGSSTGERPPAAVGPVGAGAPDLAAQQAFPAPVAPAPALAPAVAPEPTGPSLPHHQVLTAVSPLLRGPDGTHALRVQLHPQDLGAVTVTVEIHRGEVAVHLHAADDAAGGLLREHLADLRQQLEDQGVRAGALQVDSGGAGPREWTSFRQQQLPQDRPGQALPGEVAGGPAPTSPPTTAPAAAGALDLRM